MDVLPVTERPASRRYLIALSDRPPAAAALFPVTVNLLT
jgi:hypothetical protein